MCNTLLKRSQTVRHKLGSLVNNHSYAHTSAVSVIFYCYMVQNKQSRRNSLCSVMLHVVLFAYRITLKILAKRSDKNSTEEVILSI